MMNRLKYVAVLAAAVACPNAAQAQDEGRGVYGALGIGIANVDDLRITYYDAGGTFGGSGAQDSAVADADLKNAAAFKGALGYDVGRIRADLEVNYSRNRVRGLTLRSINGAPVTLTPGDIADICDYLEADECSGSGNTINVGGSRLRQLSALLNAWVDLPIGSVVTPYVGAGAGVIGYEVDGEGKARFAWQVGGGAAFNLSPSFALTADVRYRQGQGANVPDGPDAGVRVGKVKTLTFGAGLRVRF
jgi:opacity protein-like surface antigen